MHELFADLSAWRAIGVDGTDAPSWLNDLVSADISRLRPGEATRSLLLSPTGKVRAEFAVARTDEGLLLLQDPSQPKLIDALLAPYVLSSDLMLADRTGQVALFAFPALTTAPEHEGTWASAPSCLGAGVDLIAPVSRHDSLLAELREDFVLADPDDLEAWRVDAAIPRFGKDATEDDLPQECGLAAAVSFEKGCYLGQEAVAKVRNLGHPRRVLLALETAAPVSPGDALRANGSEAGTVTSAARVADRYVLLAKIRWDARDERLQTATGAELTLRWR
jgi:folate-binding protein YgfZ